MDSDKYVDFLRATAHLKMIFAALLRQTSPYPPPELDMLPSEKRQPVADSIFMLSRDVCQTLAAAFGPRKVDPAACADRLTGPCSEVRAKVLQLVAMLRAFATDKLASTGRLQRLLGMTAEARRLAVLLWSTQQLLCREAKEGLFTKGLDVDGQLPRLGQELAAVLLEINQVREGWFFSAPSNDDSFHLLSLKQRPFLAGSPSTRS